MTAHLHPLFSSIAYPVPKHPARVLLFRPESDHREDIDDENISVTRTNSTSLSRCSSTYRSRSRSPPHQDEEGVLNLDTKSTKNADDSSAFTDVKQKSPSEQQSRLEEVYKSSVDHPSSKQKIKKFSPADDAEPPMVHEDLLKNTKARRITHKDDSLTEPPILHRNYISNLDVFKLHNPSNFPLPFPILPTTPEMMRLYPHMPYPFHTATGSDAQNLLFPSFGNYQPHSLWLTDSYRKEMPKLNMPPTSPSRLSPPKAGSQPYPGSRVEPVLPNQTSVAPIH